jgi:hypothetical protein
MPGEISQKQLDANRRNAQLSTGPKTPEGKRRVRWNALKHGLLARSVVVTSSDCFEYRSQFRTLLARLHRELRPVGILEEMLVEKIAVAYWRLRRAIRAEAGEIIERRNNVKHTNRFLARLRSYSPDDDLDENTAALPSKNVTGNIVRYETAIERRLQKAVEQLQQLQRQRKRRYSRSRKETFTRKK